MGIRQTDNLLRPAQVRFRLATTQFTLFHEVSRQVASHFKDGDRPFFHVSSDTYANARFEMSIQLVALHHIKRYRTMGEQHFTGLRIDRCRIGLETTNAKQRLRYLHG